MSTLYGNKFYDGQQDRSDESARVVVPFIVTQLEPATVLDVGCGAGRWCAEFERKGVEAYGIDGPWVDPKRFALEQNRFTPFDFGTASMPFRPKLPRQRFDLVTSFEFLEHINPDRAEALVDFLTSMSNVVVAGAAIPGQGGTGHINEQWPSYWRALFERRGFQAYDFIRPAIWAAEGVQPWYLQNSIGYFRGPVPERVRRSAESLALLRLHEPASIIHPGLYALANDPQHKSVRQHASGLAEAIRRKMFG
jgi:SAM-dependent methyltransferase